MQTTTLGFHFTLSKCTLRRCTASIANLLRRRAAGESVGIARASGASHVFASDLNETRLALAMKMGADATFNPAGGGNMVDDLVEANEGRGLDVVLEMSGSPIAINTAFRSARNGGTVVLFGIPSDPVEIDKDLRHLVQDALATGQ